MSNSPSYLFVDRYLRSHEYKVGWKKCYPAETEVSCVHHNDVCMDRTCICAHTNWFLTTSTLAMPHTHTRKRKKEKKKILPAIKDGTAQVTCKIWMCFGTAGAVQNEVALSNTALKTLALITRCLTSIPILRRWSNVSRILLCQPNYLMLQKGGCLLQCLTS